MLRNIRLLQDINILQQHPRHIQRNISLANNDSLLATQVWLEIGTLG